MSALFRILGTTMHNTSHPVSHHTLTVNGFDLSYTIEGNGPDALVIGSSLYYSRVFSENLRSHFRMIFADHRGYGTATQPWTNASFEIDQLVEDMETLRKELKLTTMILIGHSGHGYIVLEYAKKYPQHVSHIILVAHSPHANDASVAAADRYFEDSVCPERKKLFKHNMEELKKIEKPSLITKLLKFGPMMWYQYDFDATPLWEGITEVQDMIDYVWGKLFKEKNFMEGVDKLNQPILLILGRYDYWNPPYLWNAVRSYFKNLRIRVLEKSGHTPQFEEPEIFDREVLSWLQEKNNIL